MYVTARLRYVSTMLSTFQWHENQQRLCIFSYPKLFFSMLRQVFHYPMLSGVQIFLNSAASVGDAFVLQPTVGDAFALQPTVGDTFVLQPTDGDAFFCSLQLGMHLFCSPQLGMHLFCSLQLGMHLLCRYTWGCICFAA